MESIFNSFRHQTETQSREVVAAKAPNSIGTLHSPHCTMSISPALTACANFSPKSIKVIPNRKLFNTFVVVFFPFLLSLFPHLTQAIVTSSGAFTTAVPIEVHSYQGLEPNLSIVYNSQHGNGWLGVGWDLQGLSEIRRASPGKGLPHGGAEDIYLLDGMELIPCADAASGTPLANSPCCKYPADPSYVSYTTKIESFLRIAFQPSLEGGIWFVWDKLGRKSTYAHHLSVGNHWHLAKLEDTLGKVVTYHYSKDVNQNPAPSGTQNGALTSASPPPDQEYLDEISYNGTSVRFYSELRPDLITTGTGVSLLTTSRRLATVAISTRGELARAYALAYRPSNTLRSVKHTCALGANPLGGSDWLTNVTWLGTGDASPYHLEVRHSPDGAKHCGALGVI